jgi:uncharacterized Zn-binding protein involved in type VI secretion
VGIFSFFFSGGAGAEKAVARLGDPSSHGGTITSLCSTAMLTDGIQTARTGSLHTCPIPGHGITPLTGTSKTLIDGGLAKVRVGDLAACGAAITAGSPTTSSG